MRRFRSWILVALAYGGGLITTAWDIAHVQALTVNQTYAVSCGSNGSAVLTVNPGGQTSTIPLTIGWFGVTGLLDPPTQELQVENSNTFLPTSQFPVYARAGSAFTTRVFVYPPGNWPVTVTETASMATSNGTISWTAQTIQVAPHLYVAGFVLPKAANGDTVNITVTATDSCGSASQTWTDVVTLAGKPEWQLIHLSS
ncbi:hypothetical protein [Alicyclobacillus acidocaldarius]|uniref:Uncharacterized protein n=1 Tax=Alicyclobacillus acidocaldarius subsp. acidocaldarius (strain ATCC 27009 / DSM 446 / BCRC 14685 / JCM 5260 / KCTC 1825 / NBRC 15652 / NCIMB 11725 / NRRL B-14509 / 104-IA) TaxID=521098 RepID=C8WSZ5_ALIAD|nr:hypothetical protein [Alicyclobacillus acidocaldarius]ACV57651.1 hypothetical protein Aaci_0603 [Alicyclobacillus acidocaldarius subsp. acidocaldarius DSM 446]